MNPWTSCAREMMIYQTPHAILPSLLPDPPQKCIVKPPLQASITTPLQAEYTMAPQ